MGECRWRRTLPIAHLQHAIDACSSSSCAIGSASEAARCAVCLLLLSHGCAHGWTDVATVWCVCDVCSSVANGCVCAACLCVAVLCCSCSLLWLIESNRIAAGTNNIHWSASLPNQRVRVETETEQSGAAMRSGMERRESEARRMLFSPSLCSAGHHEHEQTNTAAACPFRCPQPFRCRRRQSRHPGPTDHDSMPRIRRCTIVHSVRTHMDELLARLHHHHHR